MSPNQFGMSMVGHTSAYSAMTNGNHLAHYQHYNSMHQPQQQQMQQGQYQQYQQQQQQQQQQQFHYQQQHQQQHHQQMQQYQHYHQQQLGSMSLYGGGNGPMGNGMDPNLLMQATGYRGDYYM